MDILYSAHMEICMGIRVQSTQVKPTDLLARKGAECGPAEDGEDEEHPANRTPDREVSGPACHQRKRFVVTT